MASKLAWPAPSGNCCCADGDALRFGPPSERALPEAGFSRADQAAPAATRGERQPGGRASRIARVGLLGLFPAAGAGRAAWPPVPRPAGPLRPAEPPAQFPPESSEHRRKQDPERYPSCWWRPCCHGGPVRFLWQSRPRPIGRPGPWFTTCLGGQGAWRGAATLPSSWPQLYPENRWPGGIPWCANGGIARGPCSWRRVSARQTCLLSLNLTGFYLGLGLGLRRNAARSFF